MLRKLTVMFAFVFLAFGLLAPSALAAVTFDPATGTGFVGKGDVQLALGLNNKQLQSATLTFTYESEDVYQAVCTFSAGNKTHTPTRTRTATVENSVAIDPRIKNQITGFDLKGFSAVNESGDEIPVVGQPCSGGPDGGTWTSVSGPVSSGGLYVTDGVTTALLQ